MSGDTRPAASPPRPTPNPARRGGLDSFRVLFLAVIASWVLIPLGAPSAVAQDAAAYIAAGRLLAAHPGVVYPEPPDPHTGIHERFRNEYCDLVGASGPRCDAVKVAYLATPLALPFAVVVGRASTWTASLGMRLGAAVLLATGMAMLWDRLARRTRYARLQLLAIAIALTPMATTAIGFGQTSPLMFLSVCLGLSATTRGRRALAVLVWVGAGVFKAFPFALLAVLAWLRRWRFIAAATAVVVVLAAMTVLVAPVSIVGDFIRSSGTITGSTIHGSIDALVQQVLGDGALGSTLGRLAGLAAGIACCWAGFVRTDADTRWAAGYLGLLLVSPMMQLHYLWVPLGAVAIVLGAQRRLDDRLLGILTALAVCTIPPSMVADPTKGTYPTYLSILLILCALAFAVLAIRSRSTDPSPIPARSGR